MSTVITEPGVYDLPEDVYHADPVPGGSLSVSGAKELLPPSCPALFRYGQLHPPPPSQAMELGTAAHKLVLGIGAEIVPVDAGDWRTKAAKEQRDAVRAGGGVPLLRREYAEVQAMAAAIRAHPVAGPLLSAERGEAERSVFWRDDHWGIWRRGRFDHMPDPDSPRRPIITDYKTCVSASPEEIPREVAKFRYDMQDDWYRAAWRALFGTEAAFVFVFQEKTPPYLVTTAELDDGARAAGERMNAVALEIYRDCSAAGIWPGYADDVVTITLPTWARRDYLGEWI